MLGFSPLASAALGNDDATLSTQSGRASVGISLAIISRGSSVVVATATATVNAAVVAFARLKWQDAPTAVDVWTNVPDSENNWSNAA